jgi:fluoroquinolone transport system permease protein
VRAAAAYASLGAIDARNVARDPLLRWLAVLMPLVGALVRVTVPAANAALRERFGFDLAPYYPLIVSFLPLVAAGLAGTVVGFLLLDQRDDQTLTALLVTPLGLRDYLRYRVVVLATLSLPMCWVTVWLAGLRETTLAQLAVSSLVAAPLAPLYAFFLGSFAENKVQGFALSKAVGIVFVPCVAAYFVAGPWQYAFGLVPQFWPLKVFWLFDAGAGGSALAHAALGLGWQAVVLAWLARRFARVIRR